jgi:hypothetical protein
MGLPVDAAFCTPARVTFHFPPDGRPLSLNVTVYEQFGEQPPLGQGMQAGPWLTAGAARTGGGEITNMNANVTTTRLVSRTPVPVKKVCRCLLLRARLETWVPLPDSPLSLADSFILFLLLLF